MSKNISAEIILAAEQEEILNRELYTIWMPNDTVLRFVANDNVDLEFAGFTYIAATISRSDIQSLPDLSVEKVTVTMSNNWKEWAIYFRENGNKLNNCRCLIEEIFIDEDGNIIADSSVEVFSGVINTPQMTISEFKVDIVKTLGDFSAQSPSMTFSPNCQYLYFKDKRCQYAGTDSPCDKTWNTCRIKERFGGHKAMPDNMVIRN